MVCQLCVDGETCPDCEKHHPHDIHTTPPPQYIHTFQLDPRPFTGEQRIAQLEQDVHDLRNTVQTLMLRLEMTGNSTHR